MAQLPWTESLLVLWAFSLAVYDYRFRRLPNSLTLGLAGLAIACLAIHGRSALGASPLSAVAAGTGVFFLLTPFLWLGWLGAGDIKMMSAIGFIGGTQLLATTFVISSFLALPVAIWFNMDSSRRRRQDSSKKMHLPQGVFIALGLMLAMLGSIGVDST